MMMVNYTVEFVDKHEAFINIIERINSASLIAVDIETIYWWDREAERISIIQIAFREEGRENDKITVAVIDALVGINLEPLRTSLELSLKTKVIHNSVFDATRIAKHYGIKTSPIFDTMVAARKNKEKPASLKVQVQKHLGIELDKEQQRSDWAIRPLEPQQLNYAALDAVSTLLLYEHQTDRGLAGEYVLSYEKYVVPRLRGYVEISYHQNENELPEKHSSEHARVNAVRHAPEHDRVNAVLHAETSDIAPITLALLGIVSELSGRYSPEQLAASLGHDRVGVAGWIVDKVLGQNELIDEEDAKRGISLLCDQELVSVSLSRRLEATPRGIELWKKSL